MSKIEDLISAAKISELLAKKDEMDKKSIVCWVLAIVGILAVIVVAIYLIYKFFAPDYMDDFEDEFDDEFEDDFFDDDEDEYDE
ncbi:MAG: DUF4366 domain-containing protein [Clostridiales bacterium]|nr:DUF4366 domain-containing protein [Clostridiales bacterium]